MKLKAPFPWFGGKSRVAKPVWERFGNVSNYVEPFAGSLAVLLARPHAPRVETVNDLDCFVANFWRAMSIAPDQVAEAADWPVNEADLHARHRRLHAHVAELGGMEAWRKRFHDDPEYCLPWVAGWWVWGLSCWIGDNWCRVETTQAYPMLLRDRGINGKGLRAAESKRPIADGQNQGLGVHRVGLSKDQVGKLPNLGTHGTGVNGKRPLLSGNGQGVGVHTVALAKDGTGLDGRRPMLSSRNGVHAPSNQLPNLHGDSGAAGRGVHASGMKKRTGGLLAYFARLQERLRRVRVCCGDWKRVTGDSVTTCHGITGVFLDPPYGVPDRDKVYNADCLKVAGEVRGWCLERGGDPKLRIALCGYEGEHNELEEAGWSKLAWKAAGGYGARNKTNKNAARERIWFSPACVTAELFEGMEVEG